MDKMYYEGIKEVKEAHSAEEANKLLLQSYEVLRIAELSSIDLTTKLSRTSLVYILGRRDVHTLSAKKQESNIVASPEPNPEEIPEVQWTEKGEGFAWAFIMDREGKPISENKKLAELLCE
jgi:hypothetical protein